tara:strand:- start:85 stop:741 length:657 start_codon:yes stop_codon:yes gene_type:complete
MSEIDLLIKYPKSKRPLKERKSNVTDAMREISRKFDKEYFDGDRMYGYGGYRYHERFWYETVRVFYDHYKMHDNFSILDVGCGKGFMMYEFLKLNPNLKIEGVDISNYAKKNAHESVEHLIKVGNANNLSYEDKSFDLVISINTIHNLDLKELKKSLSEINRVSKKNAFLTVDAWRNEDEKERMLAWNLTAKTYMHVDNWKILFEECNYNKDYYWFIP